MSNERIENFKETELNDGIFRSDEHSLHLTAISKQPRVDMFFDAAGLMEKHKEELDKIKPVNNKIMVVEDTTNHGSKTIITMKSRHYMFKGLVYSVSDKCELVKKGDWVVWGLYKGMPFDDIVNGLKIWFIDEDNVLVKCQKDSHLTD